MKRSAAPKKIKTLTRTNEVIDYDNMSPYKVNKLKTEDFRSEMRERVKEKIDTVIKFEIEQAMRPRDDGIRLSNVNSAEKLLMGGEDDDLSGLSKEEELIAEPATLEPQQEASVEKEPTVQQVDTLRSTTSKVEESSVGGKSNESGDEY